MDIMNNKRISSRELKLSPEKFWSMKRRGIKTHDILPASLSDEVIVSFEEEWVQKIEKKSYLQYDELFPGIKNVLSDLNKEFDVVLVTLRNNTENLHWELSKLGLKSYFKFILSGKGPKKNLVEDYLAKNCNCECMIVGDTEEDIKTGLKLGMLTISVTCGIRSKEFLEQFNPDFCINSLNEIITIIKG